MRIPLVLSLTAAVAQLISFAQTNPEPRPALKLSLRQAVEIALSPDVDPRLRLAEETNRMAESQVAHSRAALLPSLDGSVAEQSQIRSLTAIGFQQIRVPVPGFSFPDTVGPFGTFDARVSVTQNLLDLSARRRVDASRAGAAAARAETDVTRDQIASQVAKVYLTALRAAARKEMAQANVTLAESLLSLAENRQAAGTGTALDVTRARVQLESARQQWIAAETERRRADLQLLKMLDLDMTATLELTDGMTLLPLPDAPVEQAMTIARKSRAELPAQQERLHSALYADDAARRERLPAVVGFADYGAFGPSVRSAAGTYTVGVSVRLPLFDGGLRQSHRTESLSRLRQEQIREKELGRQVELEVRQAMEGLRMAQQEVSAADRALSLAAEELAQAHRRYEAGVIGGLEVVESQTSLARARDSHVAALYTLEMANIDLTTAMGTIRSLIHQGTSPK